MLELRKNDEDVEVFDFSGGFEISDVSISQWIEKVRAKLEEGETRYNIASGNTAVIGIRWNKSIDIYVFKDYKNISLYLD